MTPLRSTLALLLAAGCAGQHVAVENRTTPVTQTTRESKTLYTVTIAQPDSTHPEYIKMDADVYNVGEIVEFYMINEGSGTLTCANWQPSYSVLWLLDNGTRQRVADSGVVQPAISYIKPGSVTPHYRIETTGWGPGRYLIRFDCDAISREFILREIPKVTAS
jgi:hypothetical protein